MNLLKGITLISAVTFILTLSFGCSDSSDEIVSIGNETVPAVYTKNFKNGVALSSDGINVNLRSNGTPDHVTPYWGSAHSMYETPVSGHTVTPGALSSQYFSMTIPINPEVASTPEATSLGPIGMALNGVAIFNDREGGNVPVSNEILLTFDRGGGHSGPGGLYHYHANGVFTSDDDANLIGFLRDGFPIYGRKDNDGSYPSDLDANGGHTGVTADYPNGTYHYHCSNVNYLNSGTYILKSGSYHGTKGTFTF